MGNSDVLVDSDEGAARLQTAYTVEDAEEVAQINDEELLEEIERVDFPQIRQVWQEYAKEGKQEDVYLGVILTQQSSWLASHQNLESQAIQEIIASDGYWWRNILEYWCKQQQINYYPIPLEISSHIDKGAADWEGMAELVNQRFNQLILAQKNTLFFQTTKEEKVEIEKIVIQHSSGTPALSSALYLWGIEQKLAKQPVEFVYISKENSRYYSHEGNHWRWRLKVPQIQQLIAIQDFSGVLTIAENYLTEGIEQKLKTLDYAVSLNVAALKLGLTPRQEVIERIAIALWSEKAFRERGQWMHWYMRIAGALELALWCLVEKQSFGKYIWQREGGKLQCKEPGSDRRFLSIGKVVNKLLSDGYFDGHKVDAIADTAEWRDFKQFYCRCWEIDSEFKMAFTHIRNNLYHSLLGDVIDESLDKKTEKYHSVTNKNHPSEVAVQWLKYIIYLADAATEVNQRIKYYHNLTSEVQESL